MGWRLLLLALCLGLSAAPLSRASAEGAEPVRVVVAVLPFEVHSEKPLDYLESSLAELLSTRLEASGRALVVEAVTVRETLIAWPGEKTEDVLRRLARELHADWVVVGSLTELAGRYSLDVRVTPVASRVATETMVLAAQGDDELLDRVNELAERVLVIVDRSAERVRVARIEVVGAPDEAAVRAALRSAPGQPYDEARAREDVAAIEQLPGVGAASLATVREADGVVLTYRVVPTARLMPGSPQPGELPRVVEVQVRGNRRIETAAILARIGQKPGEPISRARLAEDVRQVYALGFFRDVQVIEEDTLGGLVLVFAVEENPVIRQVTLSGNENLDEEKIKDNLTLTAGSTLDLPLLFENRQRIEALYRAEGYYLAKVRSQVEELPSDAVGVHFEVDEGEKLKLRRIEFVGNEEKSDDELSEGLKTKRWRWYSFITHYLDKSGTYSEPVFVQDLETVSNRYLDDGFVRADVGQPEVVPVPEEDGLIVRVPVSEGDQYHLGAAKLAGDETVDFPKLREDLELADGAVFSRGKLEADLEQIESHYTDRGFFMAKVQPLTQVNEAAKQVDVTYQVEKGSLFFLREIDIVGNETSVDKVVRRELRLVEGQLYSARALDLSKQRLQRLGFFEEVNFEPKQTDFDNQLDLGVKVVERPTGSVSFGAGVSSRDGFVISGALADNNLFGRGYAGSIGADLGGENDRFFLNLAWPYFLDSDFGLSTQLSKLDIEYEDFSQSQIGAEVVLSHALDEAGTTRGFLRYAFTQREIEESLQVNAASMIWREIASGAELGGCQSTFGGSLIVPCLTGGGDPGATSLLGLGFRQDTRNDRIAPTAGRILESSIDFAGLGGVSTFSRWEGRAGYFFAYPEWFPKWVPFREKSAWLIGARLGYTLPLNEISDWNLPGYSGTFDPSSESLPLDQIDTDLELPLSERYFLGGLGTFQLRGFEARSVGPRRATLVPFSDVEGTLFRPTGRFLLNDVCDGDRNGLPSPGDDLNGDGVLNGLDDNCNRIEDTDNDDFVDLDDTDVIGGNKFASVTLEYRFPIAESLGLMGIVFLDSGAAFDETQSILDFSEWRQGTGVGVLWFSPFGPLQAFLGFPLDKLSVEEAIAFEFSVGGQGF